MKKLAMLSMGLLLVAGWTAQATTINTWTGTDGIDVYAYNYNSAPFPGWEQLQAIAQSFTVPVGTTGTKFEFYCVKGAYNQTNVIAYLQVFNKDTGAYLSGAGRSMADFGGPEGWVVVDGLNLAPGNYYAQMFPSSGGDVWDAFGGKYYAGSTYAGGSGAYGWNFSNPVAGDFQGRLTVVPEPVTLILMGIGCVVGIYRKS